jgi:hypothetical protein
VEEQLQGQDPQSQFERALSELGVKVIHANSPQAKGRIERLFKTLQDRLVKEMRLSHLKTLEEANRFLKGFLARYNRCFSKAPRQRGNLHRPADGMRLDQVLCVKEPRRVANDGTIRIHGQHLQLLPPGLRPLAQKGVTVTISPKGRMGVLYEGQKLAYRILPEQPPRPRAVEPNPFEAARSFPQMARKPAEDHPWKKFWGAKNEDLQSLKPFKA